MYWFLHFTATCTCYTIHAILNIVTVNVLGPTNGLLMARTSNRFVAGIGAVLLVISHVAFAYSPEVRYMYASYGVVYCKHSVLQSIARKIYVKKKERILSPYNSRIWRVKTDPKVCVFYEQWWWCQLRKEISIILWWNYVLFCHGWMLLCHKILIFVYKNQLPLRIC